VSTQRCVCTTACPDYDEEEDIEFTQTEDVEVLSSFDTMGLKEDLLRGIYAYGTYLIA
jgi:ATP-dependent RNA helicase